MTADSFNAISRKHAMLAPSGECELFKKIKNSKITFCFHPMFVILGIVLFSAV